jgi:hypothetical protein
VGDEVAVRGVYLQRRIGTVGQTPLSVPTPVLVALAFRKSPTSTLTIEDPTEADWREVKDRFLSETKNWEEPAVFQMLRWAERQGADRLREDVRSGKLAWKSWDRKAFDAWEKEIRVEDDAAPRPFTEGARGKLWRFTGLVGQFVHEGWETVPPNAFGVDRLYVLDVSADDYSLIGTGIVLRLFCPFPLDAFPGVTGKKLQRVGVYGYFVKNYSYTSKHGHHDKAGYQDITVPTFVVVHVEEAEAPKPDNSLVWWLAGSMVVLGFLFWFFLIRGEAKDAAKMEHFRISLRQRARRAAAGASAETSTGDASRGDAPGGPSETPGDSGG